MCQPIRTVLWDFDGTLADSTELILRSYRHTMAAHLGKAPPDAQWLTGFGMPLRGQIERFGRSPAECEAMLATYHDFQGRHHDTLLHPFPGAVRTVEELERRGIAQAIVTSKYREATLRGLGLCGLLERFRVIVTPEDVEHAKPHPEPVLCALERLGADAATALMVGDSPHDLVAGRSAGVRTAAALWGPFARERLEAEGPDYLLNASEEVLGLVGNAVDS